MAATVLAFPAVHHAARPAPALDASSADVVWLNDRREVAQVPEKPEEPDVPIPTPALALALTILFQLKPKVRAKVLRDIRILHEMRPDDEAVGSLAQLMKLNF